MVRKNLPWSTSITGWDRCEAVKERNRTGYWGRCELKKTHNEEDIDHALERGMDTPRWSTKWTG